MKFIFWKAPKGYEDALAPAIIAGAARHGDEVIIKPTEEYRGPEGDGAILIGVVKREILWEYKMAGKLVAYHDKGYHRTRAPWHGRNLPAWWRICWNATHPTDYLMNVSRPADRWDRLGVTLAPRRRGSKVVILGSSAKFHQTERLQHPTQWTQAVVDIIRHITPMEISYRPKPSWAEAQPVEGAAFDHGAKTPVSGALADAWCSVTYGSIAAVDSILAGVPCVVLGNAVARPICGTALHGILNPIWESDARREQWAANLAYCHFTPDEIAAGTAWKILKETARYAL